MTVRQLSVCALILGGAAMLVTRTQAQQTQRFLYAALPGVGGGNNMSLRRRRHSRLRHRSRAHVRQACAAARRATAAAGSVRDRPWTWQRAGSDQGHRGARAIGQTLRLDQPPRGRLRPRHRQARVGAELRRARHRSDRALAGREDPCTRRCWARRNGSLPMRRPSADHVDRQAGQPAQHAVLR